MIFKCPVQDDRNIKAEIIICPHCKQKTEIFSDELKRRCPNCKEIIERESLPSCIQWCKAAKDCIGEEKWRQIKTPKPI